MRCVTSSLSATLFAVFRMLDLLTVYSRRISAASQNPILTFARDLPQLQRNGRFRSAASSACDARADRSHRNCKSAAPEKMVDFLHGGVWRQ